MKRLSDIFSGRVQEAINALDILAVEKEQIYFEVIPAMSTQSFGFMLALSMRVAPGCPDFILTLGDSAIDPFCSDAILKGAIEQLAAQTILNRDVELAKLSLTPQERQQLTSGGLLIGR